MAAELDALIEELENGAAYRFSSWPATHFERGPSGVYTIWDGAEFLYVGMASSHRDDLHPKVSGVFGRLASHASGWRSGNQFCIYICDRFVVPELTADDMAALRRGERLLDARTRAFIHERLTYRVVITSGSAEARELEKRVQLDGLTHAGQPQINPVAAKSASDERAAPLF